MSDLARVEARERVDRVKAAVTQARDDLVILWRGRAWIPLGYESWEALCDAEFGVRMALPRDERPAVVADLREQGMTTRAIGSALGVDDRTVRRDLSGAAYAAPEKVTGLDGKPYASSRPAPAQRYPELAHFSDRPSKAEAIAAALDGYDDDERTVRREALGTYIAAEQRNGGPLTAASRRDPDMDKADRLYDAVSAAARAAHTSGGPDLMARLVDRLDDITRNAWAGTYADLADRARAMADALNRPVLRSVK